MSPQSLWHRPAPQTRGPEHGEVGERVTGDRPPLHVGPEETLAPRVGRAAGGSEESADANFPPLSSLVRSQLRSAEEQMISREVRGTGGEGRGRGRGQGSATDPQARHTGPAAGDLEGPEGTPGPKFSLGSPQAYPGSLRLPAGASGLHSQASPPTLH